MSLRTLVNCAYAYLTEGMDPKQVQQFDGALVAEHNRYLAATTERTEATGVVDPWLLAPHDPGGLMAAMQAAQP